MASDVLIFNWIINSFLFNMRFSRYVSDWHFYQSFANSNLLNSQITGKNQLYGKQYNKFCKQPRPKDITLYIWGWESNPRESKRSLRSWRFSVPFAPQMPWNPQKCPYESKLSTAIFPDFSRFQIYLVKLIRAQGGCLGTKSRWKTW